jgi:hypothetical protein
MLQIALSSLAFSHSFSHLQQLGLVVTFTGIFININDKRKPKTPSQLPSPAQGGVQRPNYDNNFIAATRSSI